MNETNNLTKHLLTIIELIDGGPVKLNGGKITGRRYFIKTAEGKEGQCWVTNDRSLANYPLNEARYYFLSPLESHGTMTLKFSAVRPEEFAEEDKTPPMASSSGSSTESSNAGTAEVQPLHNSELHNTLLSAAALVGAAILVAGDKDQMEEMVPLAAMLKKDLRTVLEL